MSVDPASFQNSNMADRKRERGPPGPAKGDNDKTGEGMVWELVGKRETMTGHGRCGGTGNLHLSSLVRWPATSKEPRVDRKVPCGRWAGGI